MLVDLPYRRLPLEVVQWLLADNGGYSALLAAAREGVQWLLTAGGASITEVDHQGYSALLVAASGENLSVVAAGRGCGLDRGGRP